MGLYQKIQVLANAAERVFLQAINPVQDHMVLDPTALQTLTRPREARLLIVQALDQNVRFTIHRLSAPTATSGFRLTAGNDPLILPVEGQDFLFKAIEEAAGGTLNAQWAQ